MVATRSSTGNLPAPPRHSNLSESEEQDEKDEDQEEKPEKLTKKSVIKSGSKGKSGGHERHNTTILNEDIDNTVDANPPSPDEIMRALTEKKGRVRFLLSGPRTKSWSTFSDSPSTVVNRKGHMNKGEIGKLSLMMSLPIDVIHEIATYLMPLDLLYLSRSNRSLYTVLMSKSSRPTWIACRNAIQMPPCPPNLNEPQYASLHFEKTCQACGHRRVENVMDTLFVRLCKWCIKWNVHSGKEMVRIYFGPELTGLNVLYSLLPFREMSVTGTLQIKDRGKTQPHFLEVDFVRAVSAYLKMDPDSEECISFLEKQRRFVEEMAKHVHHIVAWRAAHTWARKLADEDVKARRREQIADRLYSLGYPYEEIGSMRSWNGDHVSRESWLKLVCQPRELTDRIWNNIRPKLEALLQSKREHDREQIIEQNRSKRESELLVFYKEYVEQQMSYSVYQAPLCLVDLYAVPLVSDMIERNDCSVEISRKHWQKIENELPMIAFLHSRKIKYDCANLLRSAQEHSDGIACIDEEEWKSSEIDSTVDIGAVWRCNAFFSLPPVPYDMETFAQILSQRRTNMLRTWLYPPWKSVRIQVERLVFHTADALRSSLGFPNDTTMSHMESLGSTFVCLQCDPMLRNPLTWDELVGHVACEIRDYRRYPRSCDIPLLETHKLVSDHPIAAHDPDLVKPSITLLGTLYKESCEMVVTRSSTYDTSAYFFTCRTFADAAVDRESLPEPQRRNPAESGDENDAEVVRPKKRTKKGAIRYNSKGSSGGHEDSNTTVPGVKNGTDAGSPSPDEVIKTLTEKKGRVRFLLSGPRTKDWPTFSDCTAPVRNRRSRTNKDDVGKLSLIMSLPIDVLYEITLNLKPLDLLYLSRTSRSLYGVFMARSSRHVWIMCENRMQMPPCPSNLNEPQYASLYFEKTCQACGYREAKNVIDSLLIRLCQRCAKLNVRSGREMCRSYFGIEISNMKKIYTLLPWSKIYKVTEYDTISDELFSKITSRRFLEVDFVRVVSAYLKTEPGSVERKSITEKQHHFIEEIMQHEKCITVWKILARKVADVETRKNRYKQTADRLHSLGYLYEEIKAAGDRNWWIDDDESAYWSWRHIVNQPKELTERTWNRVRPELEQVLRSQREIVRKRATVKDRSKRED
ncbi:hypothetical protein ACEPAG_9630 [Sanghuangporus baumii]